MGAVDLVDLLRDPDEGRPFGHFLDLAGANVGAGGPQAAQDILHRVRDVSAIVNLKKIVLCFLK